MPPRNTPSRDFQDNVLGKIVEQRQIATIYLRNRMSLRGRVTEFDPYVLMLEPLDGGPVQMVYKSSIVSISGPRTLGGRPSGPPRGGGGRYPSDGPRPPRRFGPDEGGHSREGERYAPREGERYPREGERYPREGGMREGGAPSETRSEEGHPAPGGERPFRFRTSE